MEMDYRTWGALTVLFLVVAFGIWRKIASDQRRKRATKEQEDARQYVLTHRTTAMERINLTRSTVRHQDVQPARRHTINELERLFRDLLDLSPDASVDWTSKRTLLKNGRQRLDTVLHDVRNDIATVARARHEAPLLAERLRETLAVTEARIDSARRPSGGARRLLTSARTRFDQASTELAKETASEIDWLFLFQLLQSTDREVSMAASVQTSADNQQSSAHTYANGDTYGGSHGSHSSHHDSGGHSGGYGGGDSGGSSGGGDSGGGGGGGGSD